MASNYVKKYQQQQQGRSAKLNSAKENVDALTTTKTTFGGMDGPSSTKTRTPTAPNPAVAQLDPELYAKQKADYDKYTSNKKILDED